MSTEAAAFECGGLKAKKDRREKGRGEAGGGAGDKARKRASRGKAHVAGGTGLVMPDVHMQGEGAKCPQKGGQSEAARASPCERGVVFCE